MQLRLCLAGNEPRQRYLFQSLAEITHVEAIVPFDQIDPLTKYAAAALSFAWPRVEWWENFHMHPLMQRRRRTVLGRGVAPLSSKIDALLMWGSLFQPFARSASYAVPCYTYIDQSFVLTNLPGERRGRFSRRKKSHALQARTYEAAGSSSYSWDANSPGRLSVVFCPFAKQTPSRADSRAVTQAVHF